MVGPLIASWIEELYRCKGFLIDPRFEIGFKEIADTARECEIVEGVGTAARTGNDMIDLKGHVEYNFGRPAILTAVRGTLCNSSVVATHRGYGTRRSVRAMVASSSASRIRS